MLGPDLVLTAAHCVYDTDNDQWHENITFHFGVYDRSALFAYGTVTAGWSSMRIQNAYVNSSTYNSEYDWAIIQIDKPLGKSRGYLGFHGCSSQENNKANMSACGYPDQDGVHESNNMEISNGSFYTTDGNCMRYRIFCVTGMSGGPVVDSGFLVYAIHSYSSSSAYYNGGGYMFGDYLFNMVADARTESIARWP